MGVKMEKDYDKLGFLVPLLTPAKVYAAMKSDYGVVALIRSRKHASNHHVYYTMLYELEKVHFFAENHKQFPNYYIPNECELPQPLMGILDLGTNDEPRYHVVPTLYKAQTVSGDPALKKWDPKWKSAREQANEKKQQEENGQQNYNPHHNDNHNHNHNHNQNQNQNHNHNKNYHQNRNVQRQCIKQHTINDKDEDDDTDMIDKKLNNDYQPQQNVKRNTTVKVEVDIDALCAGYDW